MKAVFWLGTLLVMTPLASGCRSASVEQGPATTTSAQPRATAATDGQRRVAKVVFVGQRNACDCTRKRIDTAWAALQQVLAKHPDVEVTQLELDVDEQEADRYDEMKPLMVPPGVYLLDGHGGLVQMLQGELDGAQLERALSAAAEAPAGV